MSCYDCNMEYGGDNWIEAVIPDKIWNKIKPDGCGDGCGILCISCIARRLKLGGFRDIPIWLCGTEPLVAMTGDPAWYLGWLRNWDEETGDKFVMGYKKN